MIANLKDLLKPAKEQNICIAQFNVLTRSMARGVIDAAEAVRVPIVIGIEEDQLDICSMQDFVAFMIPMIKNARIPIAIHLDHGYTFDVCVEALKSGFTSVNYDLSLKSFEENKAGVAELVKIARKYDATVEAELGHTSKNGEESLLTDPHQAAEFVKDTRVDALAIAVGTAHGEYLTQPTVDFDRISEIAESTDVPLVLHGGSGLSDKTVKKAIKSGITKIDLFTDLNIACFQGDIQAYNDGVRLKSEAIPYELHAVRNYAEEKIRLYSGKL